MFAFSLRVITCCLLLLAAGGEVCQAGPKVVVGTRVLAAQRDSMSSIDHAAWDTLLRKYVDRQGRVAYAAWKKTAADTQLLDRYLAALSHADRNLPAPKTARLAFWINAYNAVTIKGILREYPTTSIRNHTARLYGYNIWKDLQLVVGSEPISLEQIEHKRLRMMNEPRQSSTGAVPASRLPSTIPGMSESRPTPFANGYELVDGVQLHAEQGDRFQIPHATMKRHVEVGEFVEVRIDSPRFSVHPDAPRQCECPQCHEPTAKPVICHQEPASLVSAPQGSVPARGWGEQFWVRITGRAGEWLSGIVDNTLQETRLHELNLGDPVTLHENHILAVHRSHHNDLLRRMNEVELVAFGRWLQDQGLIP